MLWLLGSLFFSVLIVRELLGAGRADRPDPVYPPYLILLAALAVACAWPAVNTWRFERFLAEKAMALTDGKPASVHCNSVLDTMLDRNLLAAGHANPETGEIVFQTPWCDVLREYLDDPASAGDRQIVSLNLFTHEAMHIRGELNEAVTECNAVQHNYRAARLLGVPDAQAKAHASRYYRTLYASRGQVGGYGGMYFSERCGPGLDMDLRLPDSTWAQ